MWQWFFYISSQTAINPEHMTDLCPGFHPWSASRVLSAVSCHVAPAVLTHPVLLSVHLSPIDQRLHPHDSPMHDALDNLQIRKIKSSVQMIIFVCQALTFSSLIKLLFCPWSAWYIIVEHLQFALFSLLSKSKVVPSGLSPLNLTWP